MIRVFRGNYRKQYFKLLATAFHVGRDNICESAHANSCTDCTACDACESLHSAELYCLKLVEKLKY